MPFSGGSGGRYTSVSAVFFCNPPADCARQKGAGMMTLNELKNKVGDSSGYIRGMTEKELKRTGGKIIASYQLDSESWIKVYKNGGVIFCDGKRKTIFSVNDCSKACWEFATEERLVLDGDEYEDTPWNVCLYLEGMNRIEKNIEKSIAKMTISTSDDEDILMDLPSFEEGFSEIEWNDFLDEALQDLTEEQKLVFTKCMLEGLSQRRASKETGIELSSVCRNMAYLREYFAKKLICG